MSGLQEVREQEAHRRAQIEELGELVAGGIAEVRSSAPAMLGGITADILCDGIQIAEVWAEPRSSGALDGRPEIDVRRLLKEGEKLRRIFRAKAERLLEPDACADIRLAGNLRLLNVRPIAVPTDVRVWFSFKGPAMIDAGIKVSRWGEGWAASLSTMAAPTVDIGWVRFAIHAGETIARRIAHPRTTESASSGTARGT